MTHRSFILSSLLFYLGVHRELEEDALNVVLLSTSDASDSNGLDRLLRVRQTDLCVCVVVATIVVSVIITIITIIHPIVHTTPHSSIIQLPLVLVYHPKNNNRKAKKKEEEMTDLRDDDLSISRRRK